MEAIMSFLNPNNNKTTNLHVTKMMEFCDCDIDEYINRIAAFLSNGHELTFLLGDDKYDIYELMLYDPDLIYRLGLDNHIYHLSEAVKSYHNHHDLSSCVRTII